MHGTHDTVRQLMDRLRRKECVVGVIGLGYVGLPLCLAIASSGSQVIGFDIDAGKARALSEARSYLSHIPDTAIAELLASERFQATTDFELLERVDAILICVPTPLDAHREPDLSFITSTGHSVAKHLRRGQLVVLESTTYPGTTEEVLLPILEMTGLICGRDFFLAYSPEREDPGNLAFSTGSIPKVIGGLGIGRDLAISLYANFVREVVPVASVATAEAVKITENIFRAVNIALVNELKLVFKVMGVDVWQVIDAAKTKPFGYMPFYPGPGLGGHCIPIDPYYLTWKAREFGIATRFIELAGQINSNMPEYVVNELGLALDRRQRKGFNGSRILVIGVAYKKNIDDTRESPALRLIELIEARGAAADFFDPLVQMIPMTRDHKQLAGRRSIEWRADALAGYDAALIATDHDMVDYAFLAKHSKLVVDTRNACRRAGITGDHIISA